jgi:hydroxyacylglutathione hydrolase
MKKWRTKNGVEIFQVLSGRGNSYFIKTAQGNILVDTGMQFSFNRLLKNIQTIQPYPVQIDYLILTHTHFDHCRNASAIKQKFNCKIVVGLEESGYTENGYTPLPKGAYKITNLLSAIGSQIGRRWFGYQPFKADILVDNELILTADNQVKLIKTKGHSSGSISIIFDNQIAIVGDSMIGFSVNTIFPPFTDDIPETVRSWGKLLQTGCEIFLSGHGKEIKRELLHREYNRFNDKFRIAI